MRSLFTLLFFSLLMFSSGFAQLTTTPDTYETTEGELTVYPINHGTVAFTYNDLTIFVDPFGGAERFADFDAPDLIFITDIHGDHLNPETLQGLDTENTTFVVPQAVADQLDEAFKTDLVIISNGESKEVAGLDVTALPMYNLPDDASSRHKKGRGNGYVIMFGDTKLYLSGDTEDIPEMRMLENVDIAFVCMNLPYTMDIYQAASAVIQFQPKVMYPYHHRGQDIEKFKELIDGSGAEVDVRLKDWYSK
ncbi:MAG TPA: MBL fold metallo-hydrolase [Balneolaceae bacterium]|nr:MBL fold metallo-hydrolase [Balneolaceae bacterium]